MNILARLAHRQAVAAAFAFILWSLSVSGLQAQPQNPPQPNTCPAPVLRQTALQTPACPCAPTVLRQKPLPAEPTCCPVDPKQVRKAEKEAEHAQHEAAEACKRQQKAAAKAQRKIDEAYAKGVRDIERHNAKLNKRNAEWAEANAKLNALQQPAEAVASQNPQPEPVPLPETTPPAPEAERTKPAPDVIESTPAPAAQEPAAEETTTTEIAAVEMPAQTPAPAAETTRAPKELPKTAGQIGLIGLVGLVSIAHYLIWFFRR